MGAERWDEETSTLYTCAEYGEVTDGVEMDEAPVQAEWRRRQALPMPF